MSTVEEKLAKSLTAESIEIIPFLPYLLQDLWELGSSPTDMIELITENIPITEKSKILDLACGKGAVSVNIAKRFGCHLKGIDIIPEFIEFANQKAQEYGVNSLCEFIVGDINRSVEIEKDYDIVILGAVGEVLGSPEETLLKLSATIKNGGYVLLDDGYAKSESIGIYLTKEKWSVIIIKSGFELVADLAVSESDLSDVLEEQKECLTMRTNELKEQFPDQVHLFNQYLKSQLAECDELENDIIGVTMLLRKDSGNVSNSKRL